MPKKLLVPKDLEGGVNAEKFLKARLANYGVTSPNVTPADDTFRVVIEVPDSWSDVSEGNRGHFRSVRNGDDLVVFVYIDTKDPPVSCFIRNE